jgi:hypothetical protein
MGIQVVFLALGDGTAKASITERDKRPRFGCGVLAIFNEKAPSTSLIKAHREGLSEDCLSRSEGARVSRFSSRFKILRIIVPY